MRRIFLFLLITAAFTTTQAAGTYEELFSYDEEKVSAAFTELLQVETMLGSPDNFTLRVNDYFVSDSTDLYVKKGGHKTLSPKGAYYAGSIPACIGTSCGCGFFLGPLAVLAVYEYTDNDKFLVNQSMKGCLSGSIAGTVFFFLGYLWYIGVI